MSKNIQHTLLISSFSIITFATLFIFRAIDDNRLTRWQWVFANTNPAYIFAILILGMTFAYFISKVSFPERYSVVFLFFLSFFIAAIFWREPEVIIDVSRYFTQAKHLEIYGVRYFFKEWGKDIAPWTDLPLVPFLYGLIFKLFGESRFYIQLFTTILYSATVTLTYMIGKTLWDEEIGFSAGVLLLGIPYLFTQVPIMLVDVPTMFFFIFAIFAFIKAIDRGGLTKITLSSLTLFFVFFSKYSAWLMLSVLVIIFIVYLKINAKKVIYRTLIIIFISGFFTIVIVIAKYDVISAQITLLLNYQISGLRRWGESFLSTFLFQIHPLITASAFYSIYVALKKKDLKYAIISWLLLLVFFLQIKRIRYIIMVFPMLALMAAYGLKAIKSREVVKFIILCSVITSLVVTFHGYLPFVQKISAVNLKNAGEFLNSIDVENVEVFTLPQIYSKINPAVSVPVLDLFTTKKIVYHYDVDHIPPMDQIGKSSLRFTWDYKNPKYYSEKIKDLKTKTAVAIILSDIKQDLPKLLKQKIAGYNIAKVFKTSDSLFRYRTIVKVYQAAPNAGQ